MPEAQTYGDLWIRWIPYSWEKKGGWRTDIRPNVLSDEEITKALFILEDKSCIFVPMNELRRILSSKKTSSNGSITFNVNPQGESIEQQHAQMDVIFSHSNKNAARKKLLKDY